jgi:hypothetical protein
MIKPIKFIRAFLAIMIGCIIIIPTLFAIATILVVTGLIEKITIGTGVSYKIAKYLGDDSAELLKLISGNGHNKS